MPILSNPNYFMLTTEQNNTLIDALTPDLFPVSEDNIARELVASKKTWKPHRPETQVSRLSIGHMEKFNWGYDAVFGVGRMARVHR
jgi:hypothetical protein